VNIGLFRFVIAIVSSIDNREQDKFRNTAVLCATFLVLHYKTKLPLHVDCSHCAAFAPFVLAEAAGSSKSDEHSTVHVLRSCDFGHVVCAFLCFQRLDRRYRDIMFSARFFRSHHNDLPEPQQTDQRNKPESNGTEGTCAISAFSRYSRYGNTNVCTHLVAALSCIVILYVC